MDPSQPLAYSLVQAVGTPLRRPQNRKERPEYLLPAPLCEAIDGQLSVFLSHQLAPFVSKPLLSSV